MKNYPANMLYPYLHSLTKRREYPLQYGFYTIDARDLSFHTAYCGTTGSGKTNALLFFRKSACNLFRKYPAKFSYFCIDSKQDAIAYFYNNLPPDFAKNNIYYVCSTNRNADLIHYGREVNSVLLVREMINALLPDNPKSSDPFWLTGSKMLITATNCSIIQQVGDDYNFDTLVLSLFQDFEFLIELLGKHNSNIPLLNAIIKSSSERTRDTLFLNLCVELDKFLTLASIFQRAKRFISLREVLAEDKALFILGTDQENLALTTPINRLIMTRLFKYISAMPDDFKNNRIIIEIDELQKQGKIDGLDETLVFSRSKGAFFNLATQTIEGLEQVYGKESTNSILSNCDNRLIFRQGSKYSAQIFSDRIGNRSAYYDFQESINAKGDISGSYQYRKEEPLVEYSKLTQLQPARKDYGIEYYHHNPYLREFYGKEIQKRILLPQYIDEARNGLEEFIPEKWSDKELVLQPMNEDEKMRLLKGNSYIEETVTSYFDSILEQEIAKLFTEKYKRVEVQKAKNKLGKLGFKLNGD